MRRGRRGRWMPGEFGALRRVVVDGGDGVRRWRDLPPGRYALRTADVSGPLTGPLGRHTQVDVTPTTRQLP